MPNLIAKPDASLLKMLAPYIAVGIFWCIFRNAWLAIFAYHAQIILWSRGSIRRLKKPVFTGFAPLALPGMLAGPLLYFLLPHITHIDLSLWLAAHHLSGLSFVLMIPYFGVIHPVLEQIHWAPLRERTAFSHFAFAGYHVLVLYSLVSPAWLFLCFIVLACASFLWQQMTARTGNPAIATSSHILADLGIVVAAWLRIF